MNNARRKAIATIITQLEALKEEIESLQEEEQEYIDNMPENLQGSERAERSEECVYSMESAGSSISEVIDCLQESIEN